MHDAGEPHYALPAFSASSSSCLVNQLLQHFRGFGCERKARFLLGLTSLPEGRRTLLLSTIRGSWPDHQVFGAVQTNPETERHIGLKPQSNHQ